MLMIPELELCPRTADTSIRTFTGRQFWPLNPHADEVNIEDIAHALSLICRFTGHTYALYSVADHSLRVSKKAEQLVLSRGRNVRLARAAALWGLLHDASEAYVCDVSSPVKGTAGFGQLYRQIEAGIMSAVAARFGLRLPQMEAVKEADRILLNTEKRDLMRDCDREDGLERLPERIFPLDPSTAEDEFLRRFEALTLAHAAEIGLREFERRAVNQ
jgi:5'-deoxynucleotidase YfbR-like HD superfamily hydrolase